MYIVQKHNFLYIIHTDNKFWRWGDGHSSKYLAPPSKFLFVIDIETQTFTGCVARQKIHVSYLSIRSCLFVCVSGWSFVMNQRTQTHIHAYALSLIRDESFSNFHELRSAVDEDLRKFHFLRCLRSYSAVASVASRILSIAYRRCSLLFQYGKN